MPRPSTTACGLRIVAGRQRGLLAPGRLFRQDVERGARQVAGLERGAQGFVVDEVTARTLTRKAPEPCGRSPPRTHDLRASCRRAEREASRRRRGRADHRARPARRPRRGCPRPERAHAERPPPSRARAPAARRAADAPKPTTAETRRRPVADGDEGRPSPGSHVAIELGHAAQQADHHGDRVLGHLLGAVAGDVRAPDAGIRERPHVEVVEAVAFVATASRRGSRASSGRRRAHPERRAGRRRRLPRDARPPRPRRSRPGAPPPPTRAPRSGR